MILHTEPGHSVSLERNYQHNKYVVLHDNDAGNYVYRFETLGAAIKKYNEIVKELWEASNARDRD